MTLPPVNRPGPRMMSETPQPLSSRLHFMRGKATPWSVVLMTRVLEVRPWRSRASRICADAAIEVAGAGVIGGGVGAGGRGVGNGGGRERVAGIVGGRGLGVFAVGFEEADVEEEGLVVGGGRGTGGRRRATSAAAVDSGWKISS